MNALFNHFNNHQIIKITIKRSHHTTTPFSLFHTFKDIGPEPKFVVSFLPSSQPNHKLEVRSDHSLLRAMRRDGGLEACVFLLGQFTGLKSREQWHSKPEDNGDLRDITACGANRWVSWIRAS